MGPDYKGADRGVVSSLLQTWAPDPVPSPNYRGIFDPNRVPDPIAQPGGNLEEPEIVVTWRIEYSSVSPTFEEDGFPVREGAVVARVLTEIGAGTGFVEDLLADIGSIFATDEGTDHDLTWLEEDGNPVTLGIVGDWWAEEMRYPFIGG